MFLLHKPFVVLASFATIVVVFLPTTDANATDRLVPSQYPTIQRAISAAVSGDTVIVAAGTYRESILWDSRKNLTVKGAGEGVSIIDPSIANGGPGGRCMRSWRQSTASRLEGFTLQNGSQPDIDNTNYYGSGIMLWESNLIIAHCTFKNNTGTRGGGVSADIGSNPTIIDCTFTQNGNPDLSGSDYTKGGGGIYIGANNVYGIGSSATIRRCTFNGNLGWGGGAIYSATGTNPRISDCIFVNNIATNGGAIYSVSSSPTITNSRFSGNQATSFGGVMHGTSSNPIVTNCAFLNNNAGFGGGVMANQVACYPVFTNCAFTGNQALTGGAIYCNANSPVTLTNCTLVRNQAFSSRDAAIYGQIDSDFVLTNCIVWGNTSSNGSTSNGSAIMMEGSDLTATSSLVQGLLNTAPDSNGNFAADPLFVDAANGDLRLTMSSPALEVGNLAALPLDTNDLDGDGNTTELLPLDLNGDTRVVHTTVDLGAYEYQYPSASNVTSNIQVARGGMRRNNATGRYVQTITLKNVGTATIPGSLSFVLDSLSSGIALFTITGTTIDTASPYLNSTGSLAAGSSITLTLEFTNATNKAINYTPRILAGDGIR